MDPNDITTGLYIVSLGTLGVSIGFLVKQQSRGLAIQADMLKCLAELTQVIVYRRAGDVVQSIATNNWRELPDEGRAMLRKALRQVLAEMDAEITTRH